MEGLVEQVKQLTNKQQLHTREIQWLSQLYDHVQQNIGVDLLDPATTVAQICFKIIEIIYGGHSAAIEAESNSKNFVLPVDALIVSIAEIKSHTTAYKSNLNNLWHDNFYSYSSPTLDRTTTTTTSGPDTSVLTSPNGSIYSQVNEYTAPAPQSLTRVKLLPAKPYLLIARFVLAQGTQGLPLLALQDNTGEIPFEWTGHVLPALLNALSLITTWHYIPHYTLEDTGYIELPAIESCQAVWNVAPGAQIWPETLTADWHQYRAMSIEEFVVSRDKTAHLVGTVTAISPLIQQSVNYAFYFVELSAVPSDPTQPSHSTLSTTILIAGPLTFTRRLLRVGQIYYMTNLQLATLFPNTEHERRTLTTSRKSRVHVIASVERLNALWLTRERVNPRKRKSSQGAEDDHDNKRARAELNVLESSQTTLIPSQLPANTPRVSYSGELTHYCGNGIYELDGTLKLYVTQYDLEDTLGRGLRVGAHITAHNIRPITVHHQLHGFGCCVYSTVEVTAFSDTLTAFRPLVQSTNLYKPYWDALSFRDFVLVHQVYECLQRYFPEVSKADLLGAQMKDIRAHDPGHGVLATLLRASHIPLRHDTIYDQFFAHSKSCNHSDVDTSSNNTMVLTAISDITKKAHSLAVDLLDCDNWACTTAPATEFTGHLVAKCVLLDRKGIVSLHLLQRDDAIPIVIEGDHSLVSEYIDAVLLIHDFELIVENLRPPDVTPHPPCVAWLLINTHHVTILHRASVVDPAELTLAVLDRCTWPTRQDGQLRSECTITTWAHETRTGAVRTKSATLTRYMTAGMTLRVHLSVTDTLFDCRAIKFVTCPYDITRKLSVRAVLDVTEQNNAGEVALLSGVVTHIQLLEDDNSPAVYSLDYRPQRKICEGKLVVKLQDVDGPDAVDVYIRLDVLVYPLGLVPGTRATFYNLERKMSKAHSIYCTMHEESALVLHSWDQRTRRDTSNRSAALDLFDTAYFKHNTPLIEFQDPNHIRRVFVRVCACLDKIISLKAEWLCNHCKRLSVNEMCLHGCRNKGFTFHCSLVAALDDGSNQVEALVKGDLVWQLLHLTAEQTNGIMEHTMAMGPIKYTHGRYYCSDKLINAYQTRELQVIDEQINNDAIYRTWLFFGRQYYKTDGPDDEKSPPLRKAPHGLERVLPRQSDRATDQSAHNKNTNSNSSDTGLSQCYFDVRHATSFVAAAEAYQLLQEMTE